MSSPVLIIGGGVVGLSIGWHLAREGNSCLLIEKGKVGEEASLAAAGMITPVSEVRFGEEKLLQLFLESLSLYPSFIKNLEAAAHPVDFQPKGSLMVAIDQDDEAELMRLYDYQKTLGLPVDLLDLAQAREKEPLLAPHFSAALETKSECWLDNRLLVSALKQAFVKAGGTLWEEKQAAGLEILHDQISGVMVGGEKIRAAKVVLATGVHSTVAGLPDNLSFPIRPVKGQALEVKMNAVGARSPRPGGAPNRPVQGGETPPLQHAIRTIHRYPVYLVPRSDGRIVIGATSEEMGFDQKVTSGALLDLLFGAWKILPNIYEMEWLGAWAGLRPTTPDHAPILGPTSVDGLWAALGMYRHGILLTPIVGKLMAGLISGGKQSEYFEAFGYQRFKKRGSTSSPCPGRGGPMWPPNRGQPRGVAPTKSGHPEPVEG